MVFLRLQVSADHIQPHLLRLPQEPSHKPMLLDKMLQIQIFSPNKNLHTAHQFKINHKTVYKEVRESTPLRLIVLISKMNSLLNFPVNSEHCHVN